MTSFNPPVTAQLHTQPEPHLCWLLDKLVDWIINETCSQTCFTLQSDFPQVIIYFYVPVVMEEMRGSFQALRHVGPSRIIPPSPCSSSWTTEPPAVIMASGYPTPFEGAGEVKEGFLCPLCLKDLQSFFQLQGHYEEEHSGDDRQIRGQLKSRSGCIASDYIFIFSSLNYFYIKNKQITATFE